MAESGRAVRGRDAATHTRAIIVVTTAALVLLGLATPSAGQTGSADADKVCVAGDVDNLGFGFPDGFDVFSGASTPSHAYPWPNDTNKNPEADDPAGTDRIIVGSGVKSDSNGHMLAASEGYASTSTRPANQPQPIPLKCDTGGTAVQGVALQLFVDDFQAVPFGSKFTAVVNGKHFVALEQVINALDQTGPIGRLITVAVPQDLINDVFNGGLLIDDATSGVGDGYAVDFERTLINPHLGSHAGTVKGKVTDANTGQPIAGATISAAGTAQTKTAADGTYTLSGIAAGLASVTAVASGHIHKTTNVILEAGKTATVDFQLAPGEDSTPPPSASGPPPATSGGNTTTTGAAAATTTTTAKPTTPAANCTTSGTAQPRPTFGTPEPLATTCMTLQVGQRNVRAGGEVSIPVWMINGANIANINYQITYNAGIATAVQDGVSKGSFFAGALQQANTQPAGTIRVGNSQSKGENGTGSISYIKFKAVGKPGQKTDLSVTITTINDPSGKVLVIDRIDGLIQIVDPQTGLLPGDCTGKGYLDTSDAVCALQMSVGLRPVDLVVDLDKSGDVTSRDSTLIQQQVASTI